MSPSSALVTRFSTDDLAPRDRVAIWRELVFQSSFEVDIAPADAGPFRATATVHQLPGLRILCGTSPAATYRRAISKVEADDIALQFGSSDDVSTSLHRREADIASSACRARQLRRMSPILATPIAGACSPTRPRYAC